MSRSRWRTIRSYYYVLIVFAISVVGWPFLVRWFYINTFQLGGTTIISVCFASTWGLSKVKTKGSSLLSCGQSYFYVYFMGVSVIVIDFIVARLN